MTLMAHLFGLARRRQTVEGGDRLAFTAAASALTLDQQNGGGRSRSPPRQRRERPTTTMWVETWVEEIPRLCVGAVAFSRALGVRHPGSDASGPAIQATMRGSRSGAGSDRRTIRSRLMYGPCRVACTVSVYVSDTTKNHIDPTVLHVTHSKITRAITFFDRRSTAADQLQFMTYLPLTILSRILPTGAPEAGRAVFRSGCTCRRRSAQ